MFRITEDRSGGLEQVKILDTLLGESLSIVPAFGANINGLTLAKNGTLHSVLAGNLAREDFDGKGVFRGAKLFPFPNRLKDGTYVFEGEKYQMDLNYPEERNACHGFVYDKAFRLERTREDDRSAAVTLAYDYDGSLSGYPFKFRIELEYTLSSGEGFRCVTRVENKSGKLMPLGDGWHPFLTFRKKVDDILLRLPAECLFETDDRLIPTGKTRPFTEFDSPQKIGDTIFDTCFRLKPGKNGIQHTELYDQDRDVRFTLWQETGKNKYNYLQLYIPPGRDSIAVEPMTSGADAFNSLEGLIILSPGKSFEAEYGVRLT